MKQSIISDYLKVETSVGDRWYSDVCLSPNYVRLYENKENGETKTFVFKCDFGEIEHSYLKREIPIKINGETYYDITSAYGYGGPIVRQVSDSEQLFKLYNAAFNEECKTEHIISAFYRFHIFEGVPARQHFDGELEYIGPNVVKDLSLPLKENMHKSVGTSYRHAKKNGLQVEFDTTDKKLDSFLKVYKETMDRNDASEYYYFDPVFFRELCRKLEGHYVFSEAVLEGKVISSFITLYGTKHALGFLGGTLTDYLSYDASTFLEYETMQWLKANGLHYYILGGGVEGEDNLFRFKKKFDKEGIFPYYVGKKIYDQKIYDQLVELKKKEGKIIKERYFPLYRSC